MAIATLKITCKTCGIEFKHLKECRNCKEAERYKEWARDHITECYDCYRESSRKAWLAYVEEKTKEYDLPELIGTEKQVEWANDIRLEFFENAMIYQPTDRFIKKVKAQTSAKWWIDVRYDFFKGIVSALICWYTANIDNEDNSFLCSDYFKKYNGKDFNLGS